MCTRLEVVGARSLGARWVGFWAIVRAVTQMPPAPSEWYCDRCSQMITDPARSLVVWRCGDDFKDRDFLVVHKGKCDPGSKDENGYSYSHHVSVLLGDDGQSYLLAMLSSGPLQARHGSAATPPADLDEFVDLFRRLQTPFYEEARRHFDCVEVKDRLSDANEVQPYLPETLQWIASHQGDCQFV